MSGIHLRGDWRKLNPMAKKLGDTSDYFKNELIAELAEEVREALVDVVSSHPDPDNADSTVNRKGFNAPMEETGTLTNNSDAIVATPLEEGRKVGYIIEGNPNMMHRRTGVPYSDIIAINSLGGGSTPSRDLLDIAYDRKREEIKRHCIMKVKEHWR